MFKNCNQLLEIPEVLRLNGVDQNSGVNLTGFNTFKYKYSIH